MPKIERQEGPHIHISIYCDSCKHFRMTMEDCLGNFCNYTKKKIEASVIGCPSWCPFAHQAISVKAESKKLFYKKDNT